MLNNLKNNNKTSLCAFGALAAIALALVPGAARAAPVNDDDANSLPLLLNTSDTRSNVGASIGPGEGLTANDPDGDGCTATGDAGPGGVQMDGTLWWDLVGNGGPVTISTVGSNFDTVLAVYDTAVDDVVGCDDDIQPGTGLGLASEVVIHSVAGRHYDVQVGGCAVSLAGCNATTSGEVTLRASSTPPNDGRANATPVAAGSTKVSTSKGATVESGEVTNCTTSSGATSLYGKTVWFRWHAPAPGTAGFTVSGFDTVLAVYRGEDPLPFGCNDDAISKAFGGSSLPMTQPPGAPVSVAPGDYLIQVGGYYDLDAPPVAARDGQLTLDLQFTENLDVDGDGVTRPLDCNDSDPSIHPGATEITNNNTDENCDGVLAFDRDHDGYLAPPAGGDCHDDDPGSHPGARDVPGNRVDEDCNGADAARPALKAASIDARFVYHPTYTIVDHISVRHVPAGSRVVLRCRGPRRDCRFRAKHVAVRRAHASLSLLRTLHLHLPSLHAGTRLRVDVTKDGHIGLFRAWTMRRGTSTYRVGCLTPDDRTTAC
jgi:Putative metal-binding motif